MKKLLLPILLALSFNAFSANHVVYVTGLSTGYQVDNRAAIQAFLDQALTIPTDTWEFKLPPNRWYVDSIIGLRPHSNTTLTLYDTDLYGVPNGASGGNIIRIDGKTNVTINGSLNSRIVGDRVTHTVVGGGEWGMGIAVYNSSNVNIRNIGVADCFGDGIYIGTGVSNLDIKNVRIDRARRQAMTLISCINCTISDSQFYSSVGVDHSTTVGNPNDGILYQGLGIDFEANYQTELVSNVTIQGCTFGNNYSNDINFYTSNPAWTNVSGVKILDNIFGRNLKQPSLGIGNSGEKAVGDTSTTPSILVKGNTFHTPFNGVRPVESIAWGSAKYVRIEANTFINDSRSTTGSKAPGIYAPNTTYPSFGNVVINNTFNGVAGISSPNPLQGTTFTNNLVNP